MEQPIYQTVTIGLDILKVEGCLIKSMDLEHYYKLRNSIKTYGQLRNILVDDQYNVIEGRKIAGVMRELGFTTVEVKIVPADFLVARLNLDSEYSTFDFIKVSMQLSKSFDLNRKDHLKDVLPFKNVDIDDYIEAVDFSFEKYNAHKNQVQGSLFGEPAPYIKPAPVTVPKPVEKPQPTLFGPVEETAPKPSQTVEITESGAILPEGVKDNEPFTVVIKEPVVEEPVIPKEPEPESFADRRAREVREEAERNGRTE